MNNIAGNAAAPTNESLHDWLMSDRPQSRRQASLGRAYGAWRTFARNRLAMLGLAIVIALVLVAILADVLRRIRPISATCAPPGCCHRARRTGSAPTTRAATSCRA